MCTATDTATATTPPPSVNSAATRKHMIPPETAPFIPLSLRRGLPNFSNLHGIVLKIFKGFTNHFSNYGLIFSNNPLLKGFTNHSVVCPDPAIATAKAESSSKSNNKKQGGGGKLAWDGHGLMANCVVELNKLNQFKRYKVSNIKFLDPRSRLVVKGADECFGRLVGLGLRLQSGGVYTKQDLMEKLKTLQSYSQDFVKIEMDAKTNPDGSLDINIPFTQKLFPSKTKFTCVNVGSRPKPIQKDAYMTYTEQVEYQRRTGNQTRRRIESGKGCILPRQVQQEIESMLLHRTCLSSSLIRKMANKIRKWYHDNGYNGAGIVQYHPHGNREIIYEVVEGEIKKLAVIFKDKLGNVCQGNTNIGLIKKAYMTNEVAVGKVYTHRAINKAYRNIDTWDIFSKVETILKQDKKTGDLSLEIVLQEHPRKWSEVSTEWNIVPGPTMASLQPGAKINFGYRNIKGLGRSFQGEINLCNLFDPEKDTSFRFEYKHPYLDGIDDPRNRTFHATCFNSRKLSPVFRGGPGVDDAQIWVDRVGVKANITEDYTRQSKFTYGLVMEDIRTRDAYVGADIVDRAHRVSVNGQPIANGPRITLSGTGVDRMAFFQANLLRDNTRFVNGAIIGERDVFQVDQGLGIGAFFNRHKLSATRFIPLKKVEEDNGKAPPPVLVLHGLYGGCVGDLPNHEAFTIGGPYSVRGYNMGEIGASRYKLEVAAEVRVPVKAGAYVYGFAEHGNDLGSSMEVQGNPTKSYMRKGHGSSYGVGVKLGQVRAEYAVDNNTSKGAFFFRFGDRF